MVKKAYSVETKLAYPKKERQQIMLISNGSVLKSETFYLHKWETQLKIV